MGSGPQANHWRRCCRSYRRRFFICSVIFVIVFFLCTLKSVSNWCPHQWTQNQNRTLQVFYESRRQHTSSSNSSNNAPDRATVTVSGSAGFKTITESAAFSQGHTTSTQAEHVAASIRKKKALMSQQVTQRATVRPTPVPYVSPGPYVVEYPYQYHFIINEPHRCEQEKPFVVLVVPVAFSNRARRDIIRRMWGSEGLVLGKVVTVFFLLGVQGAGEAEPQLQQESDEHRDLIQSDFVDCYKNLTIKTMVMLEWLDSYCPSAPYAMKIDSDVFLNVENLVKMLLNAPKTNYLTGLVARNAAVRRDRESKWYLPAEVYPRPYHPVYALGLGYVLSLDLPKRLIEASRHLKAVYIEDVFVGLCMEHIGIPLTDPPNWNYFQVHPVQYSRCSYSKIVAITIDPHADLVWLWDDFKKPGVYC